MQTNLLKSAFGMTVMLSLLSGCAVNMKVAIHDPLPSKVSYDKTKPAAPVALNFKDEQSQDDKTKFFTGPFPMNVTYDDKPFDATPWVATHTVKEMAARGLPVTMGNGSGTTVAVKRVHLQAHRASGFAPFVTFTSLRADVDTANGPQRVTAYVKRGKVPVWSFDEVIEPTFNEPLALLTKELAAKLNQQLFGQVVGDEQVKSLIAKVEKEAATNNDSYLDVYQLGYSNNPLAVSALVKLTSHTNEYVRLAAISSLGILKANDQFTFLTGLYENSTGLWQDRAMALKAIGDLGSAQSRAYMQKEKDKAGAEKPTTKEQIWNKQIIDLYID